MGLMVGRSDVKQLNLSSAFILLPLLLSLSLRAFSSLLLDGPLPHLEAFCCF